MVGTWKKESIVNEVRPANVFMIWFLYEEGLDTENMLNVLFCLLAWTSYLVVPF